MMKKRLLAGLLLASSAFICNSTCLAANHWCLIGFGYENLGVENRLKNTVPEIEGLESLLKGEMKETNVAALIDEDAKKDDIKSFLTPVADENDARFAKDGDDVIVVLNGHGVTVGGEFYFCPPDVDPATDDTDKLISLVEIHNWVAQTGDKQLLFEHLYIVCSACRSTGAGEAAKWKSLPADLEMTVVYACQSGETAKVHPADDDHPGGYGYFFKAFHEGLQGAAANDAKEITLGELDTYISNRFKNWRANGDGNARNDLPSQTPYVDKTVAGFVLRKDAKKTLFYLPEKFGAEEKENWSDHVFREIDFGAIDLARADLDKMVRKFENGTWVMPGYSFNGCEFVNCKFNNVRFLAAKFSDATFRKCDLKDADFTLARGTTRITIELPQGARDEDKETLLKQFPEGLKPKLVDAAP